MPVPIRINNNPEKSTEENTNNMMMDFSILMSDIPQENKMKRVSASNKDANLLFEIWSNCEKSDSDTFKVTSSNINSRDLMRLKTLGFLHGDLEKVTFTNRGKTVVCTMALSEPNRFEQSRQQKSYSEILASMDKKNKSGYRTPKYASSTSSSLDVTEFLPVEKENVSDLDPRFSNDTMLNTFIKG